MLLAHERNGRIRLLAQNSGKMRVSEARGNGLLRALSRRVEAIDAKRVAKPYRWHNQRSQSALSATHDSLYLALNMHA